MSSNISSENWVGKPLLRKEDARFVTGAGSFVADIADKMPDVCYISIVRSPHASAKIISIATEKASAFPGVLCVFTGQDLADADIGGLPCAWPVNSNDGTPMAAPEHRVLATDHVLHVGDPIAVVVAQSLAKAEEAASFVQIEYEAKPSQTDLLTCLDEDSPIVHPGFTTNQCFDWELGEISAVEQIILNAPHVVELELVQNRVTACPMETRGTIGIYDQGRDNYTLYTSTQNPHAIRVMLSASTLKVPEEKIRIISPDVGGGFGMKIYHYSEEVLVLFASKLVNKPVRWTATRLEAFLADSHAGDHVTEVSLGFDDEGKFLALKVDTLANMGALSFNFCACHSYFLLRKSISRTLCFARCSCACQRGVYQHNLCRCV